jgi:ribosomal protection tetracycline resistance protein
LNLGILAHVDAGKTTLTERLLYAAGAIDELGSVDDGTTQTDFLALERQRGITIKSAVVSFAIDDVTVNLIDTPGHPDFIAEVERVLAVLDGAVLVISAVEGVQPQTRILMRALQRLRVPTLLFVNKIDRRGADVERVLAEIRGKLTPAVVAMASAIGEGGRSATVRPHVGDDREHRAPLLEVLAEQDDALLREYIEDETAVSSRRLREALVAQTRQARVYPAYCGSALTGAGVEALTAGIGGLLPASTGEPDEPAAALVFKIERSPAGERIAYVRMFTGRIATRDRVLFGAGGEGKVTGISVFADGSAVQRPFVSAGEIAKLSGLREVQIGDSIGDSAARPPAQEFPPPTLESVVAPVDPADGQRLRVALGQLAEQDPLIAVRQDDSRGEISVSLYGDVQREVIEATLANEYGLEVETREPTTICIERPTGTGDAVELLNTPTNPFHADLGLRVEPAAPGSGVDVIAEVDPRDAPLYVFKTFESFAEHMGEYVRLALEEGLFGWQVTDCVVTLTKIGYSLADGPPGRRGPMPTAGDLKRLTPIVLLQSLERSGSAVCQPVFRITAEVPTNAIGRVLAAVGRLGAAAGPPSPRGELSALETTLPASGVRDLRRQLPGLTGGEGVFESEFAGYQPVSGDPPIRKRTTPDPLNLDEYLAHLRR